MSHSVHTKKQTGATPGALRTLLTNLVDYAGLFPPAALDLPAVVRNYATYLGDPDAWMLGRLIIPTAKLTEFEGAAAELLPTNADADPWRISALVKSAAMSDLEPAMATILQFHERHAQPANGAAVVETIELKAENAAQMDAAIDTIPDAIFPFFEIASDSDPRGLIAALTGSEAGAKIRTGGVSAELYPSPEHVARFIGACAAANVPFKATAGMHHPLRHRNESVGADEFGFLNVFIAACAAAVVEIDDAALVELLTDTSADAFAFDDHAIRWGDMQLSIEAIDDLRNTFAISFGSCSFDEPRSDLRALGLLI